MISQEKQSVDKQLVISGDWALASDGAQWILQRKWKDEKWRPVSFVRSDRDILERCMREKGTDNGTVFKLLSGLADSFDRWKASQTF